MGFRVIAVNFLPNNGPLDRRDTFMRNGVAEAFALAGQLAATTNGGVVVVDECDCVWFEYRVRGGAPVQHATREQRQLYGFGLT